MAAARKQDASLAASAGAWPFLGAQPLDAADLLAHTPFGAQAARFALYTIDSASSNLRVWRAFLDASRDVVRAQQDVVLGALRGQLCEPDSAPESVAQAAVAPIAVAIKSYSAVGAALLQAQREAAEAFARH